MYLVPNCHSINYASYNEERLNNYKLEEGANSNSKIKIKSK